MEEIYKKYVNNYNKKFDLYDMICRWELHFEDDTIIHVKSERMCNTSKYCDELE